MKEKIWMVALLVIVAFVSAFMLSIINIKTKPIVQRNSEIKLKKSVLDVFLIDYNIDNVESVFTDNVEIIDENDLLYYKIKSQPAENDSSEMNRLIAFKINGPGFWGTIDALIALRSDLKTIEGIKFLKHDETPGLGGRIEEEWFCAQFKGKIVEPKITRVPYNTAKNENEFDAITGATETSRSVEALINNGISSFSAKLR